MPQLRLLLRQMEQSHPQALTMPSGRSERQFHRAAIAHGTMLGQDRNATNLFEHARIFA